MSPDIKKSCSFQILISLTTVVWLGYCHLKSGLAALNWCWCCHFVFWPDAPPSTYRPITKSVVFRDPGCQLCSNLTYPNSSRIKMSNVTKSKRPRYNSEIRCDKVRNKTRICIGDAFERWRRLKTEKNLNTDANVANFLLDR